MNTKVNIDEDAVTIDFTKARPSRQHINNDNVVRGNFRDSEFEDVEFSEQDLTQPKDKYHLKKIISFFKIIWNGFIKIIKFLIRRRYSVSITVGVAFLIYFLTVLLFPIFFYGKMWTGDHGRYGFIVKAYDDTEVVINIVIALGYELDITGFGKIPTTHVSNKTPVKIDGKSVDIKTVAATIAKKHGIPVSLFQALITQESLWDPNAKSWVGAMGLTQLMPSTAKDFCKMDIKYYYAKGKVQVVSKGESTILDPVTNLNCGASYLAWAYDFVGRDWHLALAAYNSGPGRVKRLGRVPPIKETQNYVHKICSNTPHCSFTKP